MISMMKSFLLIVFVAILVSCGDYQKVLKSTDYEFKFKKAKEYYEDNEYARSVVLFEELVTAYRGTSRAAEVYYFLSKSYFGQKDYLLAGHFFRQLIKDFPRSEYSEESQFLIGYCFYMDSPKARLDQGTTQKGIDALQLFVNIYPTSERLEEANGLIKELREKLVYKSYLNGRLYYDLSDYRAAVISLGNSIKEYPDTKYREELMYLLLKSKYLLGENSIDEKKRERLNIALDEYFSFVDEYPESKYRKDVDKMFDSTKKMLNLSDEDLNIDN
jgi:outer membrane protein assembly factor BamD